MLAIGIDPGLGGAIAWTLDGVTVDAENMPHGRGELYLALQELSEDKGIDGQFCVVERLSGGCPMRDGEFQQKRSTMWKLGQNYGEINMACHVLFGDRVLWLAPREWQKSFSLIVPTRTSTTVKKNAHKAAAEGLYPGCKPTLKTCDAILLTYFSWQRAKIESRK